MFLIKWFLCNSLAFRSLRQHYLLINVRFAFCYNIQNKMSEIINEPGRRDRGNGLDGVPAVFYAPIKAGWAVEAVYSEIRLMVTDNTGLNSVAATNFVTKCEVYVGTLKTAELDSTGIEQFNARGPKYNKSILDVSPTQSLITVLPWPVHPANNFDSSDIHKIGYQLTYDQAKFASSANNQHVYVLNSTKILWVEDNVWLKLRPTRSLGLSYTPMVLSGVFMYWYQALSPSGVKKLDQLFDLPLIADMRLRGIEVITENVHIVRLNILLNGNHISYKDAPVLMLKRESSMGDNSNDTETGQNTIYVTVRFQRTN